MLKINFKEASERKNNQHQDLLGTCTASGWMYKLGYTGGVKQETCQHQSVIPALQVLSPRQTILCSAMHKHNFWKEKERERDADREMLIERYKTHRETETD